MTLPYRYDIDGLRALAVFFVIFFHLELLANGFLGVDIFFVISGYLIAQILYNQKYNNQFLILNFYLRRIRRIFPLVLFITAIALILGVFYMLPDDLENLAQAIIATNFSANNILMYLTTYDYWEIKNNYKPLMHTWSLGVEEQFYLVFPLLFVFLKKQKQYLFVLTFITICSLVLLVVTKTTTIQFYFLPFRLFELTLGALAAIYFFNKNISIKPKYQLKIQFLWVLILVSIILFFPNCNHILKLISITFSTIAILIIGKSLNQKNNLYTKIFANKTLVFFGKISFSLYMWHQLLFAFSRYFLFEKINAKQAILLVITTILFSTITYFFIEKPFRNPQIITTKKLILSVFILFIVINTTAMYIYLVGGIIKNVPQLGITTNSKPSQLNFFSSKSNIHIYYNEKIQEFNKPFQNNSKIKILILGNSFARDIANVLLESSFQTKIQISYSDLSNLEKNSDFYNRIQQAEHIFFGSNYPDKNFLNQYKMDTDKIIIFGTKDFGNSNGIHYNKKNINFKTYRTTLKQGVFNENKYNSKLWKSKYIDLIQLTVKNQKVLVFTPNGKFISQDTKHFTQFGAKFYAQLLNNKLKSIVFK